MSLDLESLRLIGWLLLGATVLGVAVFEGISLGVHLILPLLCKTDQHWQAQLAAIKPVALINLGWFIALLLVLFAAWPISFAVALASFEPLLLIIVVSLMLRLLALFFIDQFTDPNWITYARKALGLSGLLPTVLLGLIAGNILKGVPFHLDSDMRILFLGDVWGLFNPFAMLVVAVTVALFAYYGALFVQHKISGELQQTAQALSLRAGIAFIVLFALTGLWIMHLEGYHISSDILPNASSNPLSKFVKRGEGLWLDNYEHQPFLAALPSLAFICAIASIYLAQKSKTYWALLCGVLSVANVTLTFGSSLFPFLLPSNLSLNSSMTIWDSSASQINLEALLWFTVPALLLATIISRWLYGLFAGKIELAMNPEPLANQLQPITVNIQSAPPES